MAALRSDASWTRARRCPVRACDAHGAVQAPGRETRAARGAGQESASPADSCSQNVASGARRAATPREEPSQRDPRARARVLSARSSARWPPIALRRRRRAHTRTRTQSGAGGRDRRRHRGLAGRRLFAARRHRSGKTEVYLRVIAEARRARPGRADARAGDRADAALVARFSRTLRRRHRGAAQRAVGTARNDAWRSLRGAA